MSCLGSAVLPLLLPILLATAPLPPPAGDWEALQARGAALADIQVELKDVFDLADPADNTWVGRLGDHVHATTREPVIRAALLFRQGEPVNARKIRETERHLRTLPYLKDARIDPEVLPDGTVRAWVRARDAWTLKFSVNYKLVGGQQTKGVSLLEQNLLGTGKSLVISYVKDPVRTTGTAAYYDPQVLGSTWTFLCAYQNLSDGSSRLLVLQRPFLQLDTPWAATVQAGSTASTFALYDHGATVYAARSVLDTAYLGFAWKAAATEREAWRPGAFLVARDARYGPLETFAAPGALAPPDLAERRLRGLALSLSYFQDGYRTFKDLAAMDLIEDYNLGLAAAVAAGSYSRAWNATESASFGQAQASKGWAWGDRGLALAQAGASGRRGPAGWEDGLADLTLTGYWKETPHEITAARLALDAAHRPDPEDLFYAGANEGLRGYGNYLHPGNGRWLGSLQQRILTEYRWLGILRLGYVVFADAGAIHRLDGSGWTSTYKDVGAGLRLGDLKSSLGKVVFLTLAAPLAREPGQNKWQALIGNVSQF